MRYVGFKKCQHFGISSSSSAAEVWLMNINPTTAWQGSKEKGWMEQLGAFTLILHNYTGSFDDLFNSIQKSSFYRHLSQVPTPG